MQVKTKLTAEEFFKLYPECSRIELINREVYEMPGQCVNHQRVVGNLYFKLISFLKEGMGEVLLSPVDVVFDQENVLQPDLVYVSDPSKVEDKVYGVPELVVEVISPQTLVRDFVEKRKLYERFKVKEYWLIFPLEKTMFVYELTENGYELFSYATERGKVKSKILEGFELELEEFFKELTSLPTP